MEIITFIKKFIKLNFWKIKKNFQMQILFSEKFNIYFSINFIFKKFIYFSGNLK